MKTDLFQSCGYCWVFQICWHIECSTFRASSFRTWKSSTGIPSPPLALFIVMLPKAHLTLHFRMPGSRWVITPSWLSGPWRSFLYSSSVYSCHLFLISSTSVRSIPLLFYCAHLCMKRSLGVSNFHEGISSLAVWGHPRWTGHGGEVWRNVVHWRREWQTTSVFLTWEPHEQYEKAKR